MRHLSQPEIDERTRDIFANIVTLSERGQISFHGINPEGEYWIVLWTDVLEEMEIRGGGFRSGFMAGTQMPVPTHPDPPRSKIALLDKPLPAAPYLVKLGHRVHMERALAEGVIRLSPAASFSDASLNPAIRDDELSIGISRLPEDMPADPLRAEVPLTSPVRGQAFLDIKIRALTNYYVHCMAHRYELRLFDDFKYDACLVVREPRLFISRVQEVAAAQLPGWSFAVAPVRYIDPLNHGPALPDVFFSKHFRYSYQREFRLGWLPPSPMAHLEPLDLRLGALDDICDLIVLPG